MSIAAAISETTTNGAARADARAGKYLTFHLDREEFGVQVLQVREIMGLQDITPVPHTAPHVKGVINLRGKVIPVICLRAKFAMSSAEFTARTCIIVVQIRGEAGIIQVGVIVDAVSEVLNISPAEIEDVPDFGTGIPTPFLLGMAKVKEKVKILLDIDQVLGAEEITSVQAMIS